MALWRVVSSTRIASRSPRRRGWARWSRPSASRAARTASRSSVLAVAARRAGRTVDLDDPFALLEQVGGEAGDVAAGALDRPDPTSWRLLDCEPVAAAVAVVLAGTLWCAMTAPAGLTRATVWLSLWVSTPMMWSTLSASMVALPPSRGGGCRCRPWRGRPRGRTVMGHAVRRTGF